MSGPRQLSVCCGVRGSSLCYHAAEPGLFVTRLVAGRAARAPGGVFLTDPCGVDGAPVRVTHGAAEPEARAPSQE